MRQYYNIPSLIVGYVIAKNVSSIVIGVRVQSNPQPVQIGDVLHLGACTASVTAILAAKCADEGHFSWNTTLSEIDGSGAVHTMHQNTTIGMLSSSTAGI